MDESMQVAAEKKERGARGASFDIRRGASGAFEKGFRVFANIKGAFDTELLTKYEKRQ